MSSKLFTAVLEYSSKRHDWHNTGINDDEKRLHTLKFADDIFLISDPLGEANNIEQQWKIFKTKFPIHLKRTDFNRWVLPVQAYEVETLTLIKTSAEKLQRVQRNEEKSMLDITLRNKIGMQRSENEQR